jgi:tetratricopeptide (TPR) repeat protein
MKKKNSITIKSSLHKEISTNLVIDGKKYLILTEDLHPEKELIITNVYLGGKLLLTKTLNYRDIPAKPDRDKKIEELIQRQHKTIAEVLKKENIKRAKTPTSYLDEVKNLLQKKNKKGALELLTYAMKKYPDDPFLLSYYGCLEAIINKNYEYGMNICQRAIEILNEKIPFGQEIFFPTFYLNLGRARLSSGNKQDAVTSFQQGLSYDRENKDLLWEIKKLGMRKKPLIPYLKRSNPINKYIGMILHTVKKDSP